MGNVDTLVSIGLPVRNAADRVEGVIRSVLAQDHDRIELVVSDNASTDATEEVCRDLAKGDHRIAYHRQPENVGLLNNFMRVMALATGELFRWIGDDDRLEPAYVSRCLREFAADPRLILVTTQVAYEGPDGRIETGVYDGRGLDSDEPVDRFVEMLRLLNESHLMIDPLYGLLRREPVAAIPRRNMLREDEVFATKLALAGPWRHVPQVLAYRSWKYERFGTVARRLGVPAWQSHCAFTLQAREILRWLRTADLTPEQRRRARAAVYRMHLRRERQTLTRRGGKLLRMVTRR
jgi:glycosyltransferase involved in cell wall biosynthesis